MASVSILASVIFSQLVILLSAQDSNCPSSFQCGDLGVIEFPFTDAEHSDCGLFVIHGCESNDPNLVKYIQFNNISELFQVTVVGESFVSVRDYRFQKELLSRNCDAFARRRSLPLINSALVSFHFEYKTTEMIRCNHTVNATILASYYFSNYTSCPAYDLYFGHYCDLDFEKTHIKECSKVQLRIQNPDNITDPFSSVAAEIPIRVQVSYDCNKCHYERGGQCRLDTKGQFFCAGDSKGKSVIIPAAVSAAVGVGVLFLVLCYYLARLWRNKSKARQDFEAFLKSHGPLAVRRYSYSDLKRITNSFKEKLGQGGYGAVYKGKFGDGCEVAVKILSESKGNGEEFINEVASISRTSHVNIVNLLGFCFEGKRRALVYEYMPNGSLEKFIYKTNLLMNNHQLDTEILFQIAIGVAQGLEYLHRGCNTRIFHFDIKPHNILLEDNFCPKISDFELAKVCTKMESVVSMQVARGTIGYIAPEVFNRHFGKVSHKSDVYSYGMMVLEMVGGRKNINAEVDHTSEIYFPHWIYKRLELNEEFALHNISNDNDKERIRKMVIVSLWCIQTNPTDRPTMRRVIEMLEGGAEILQVPPKPFLSSPPRSPPISSTH